MPATDDHDSLTLPEGTRLFYIGPPKTGTTSLQEAARAARETLYEHGVHYPGTGRHHRAEVRAMLRDPDYIVDRIGGEPMRPGATYREAGRVPPRSEWTALMKDIDVTPSKRVLITHERAASSTDDEAAAFVDELGRDRTHIVITLRPLSEILVSQWIEEVKEGLTASFEDWLVAFYETVDELVPARRRRYLDHARLVERWVDVAGKDRVTVIVADKTNKDLLPWTFERLLGVPEGTLTGVVSGGVRTNRSMSLAETQVIQRVNAKVVHPDDMSWPAYLTVVKRGAITRILEARTPGEAEGRVRLPQWAAERAERDGIEYAKRIAASGVRVVGDLDRLGEPAAAADDADNLADQVAALRDIAVESLVGAVRATTAYEKRLARRIDRAREQRDNARERREKVQARLERVMASRDKARDALERQKAKTQKTQQRIAGQKEKLQQARGEVARLRRRTIRDQVKRLPADQRARKAAESFSTRDLVRALWIRLGHKARTRQSLRLK